MPHCSEGHWVPSDAPEHLCPECLLSLPLPEPPLRRVGPFQLLEARRSCGIRINAVRGYCDFDLATAGIAKARYVRVEDGELYPCPGDTVSEGADLDAVQALGVATTTGVAPAQR